MGMEGLNGWEDETNIVLYKKVIGTKTTIASRTGQLIPAGVAISYALRYLYNHIMRTLKHFTAGNINAKQIRWVLTVPAIWSESAKQMMRRAAWQAGIIENLTSKRLKIALEPEAASFWCRELPLDKFKCDDGNLSAMPDETTYMVVDCGGGTIDITVHKLDFDGTVKEVYRTSGGNWGGTSVDDKFIGVVEKLFGTQFVHQYKKECPHDWLEFCEQFETKKRSLAGDKHGLKIQLTYGLGDAIKEKTGRSVEAVIQDSQITGLSFKNGVLIFKKDLTEQFFLPSVNKIVNHVKELLSKPYVQDVEYVFMVGGYSDCAILQENMIDNFGSKLKIMIPEDPGMCVMKGAVLFGHYPETITSRIARKTYGQALRGLFIEGKHDPSKKITVDGVDKCEDLFNLWIAKNESIKTDESRVFTSIPSSTEHTVVATRIYSSDKNAAEITYITDPDVKLIGMLTVQTPDVNLPREQRTIETKVFFGSTEMYVHVMDKAREHGDTAETNIDFLCE